jgi:PIN domain nuclease of toxin-antitoxin system
MALKYILDTHALIWYLEANPRLGSAAKMVMDNPASEMILPIIALAEAVDIVHKGRTRIPTLSDLLSDVMSDARIEICPLSYDVLQQSLAVTAMPEMHDRLIVATALHLQSSGHQIGLLTRDPDMVTSALVRIVW